MLDNVTTVEADKYPFYDNEAAAPVAEKKSYGFDMFTPNMYRAVTAAKVAPNKLVTTNQFGRFPWSSIPRLPVAVTNRAETILYKIWVEDDGVISYDVGTAPDLTVTNHAVDTIYKLYIENDGVLSYDEVATAPLSNVVTNRAGNTAYRLYVEDDGAISYDII